METSFTKKKIVIDLSKLPEGITVEDVSKLSKESLKALIDKMKFINQKKKYLSNIGGKG